MLISVLLPYRDAAATIEEALESVLTQTGVELDIVAVDDGSHDAGPQRVAQLDARHPGRMTRLTSGGVGLVGALAAGLQVARGELVARMDGDDVCRPGRLAAQARALAADDRVGALGTRVAGFPAAAVGEGMRLYIEWQNGIVTPEEHERELLVESPLCHPSVMLRRRALDAVGGWRNGPFPEDYDLWLRLHEAGWRLAKVPEVLFDWRHREGRATFTDPRYAPERFLELKTPHLAARLRQAGRPWAVLGAGPTGKRLARALEQHGLMPRRFVDIDARKLQNPARGVPVDGYDTLRPGGEMVVVAVGARGARAEIRGWLLARGFVEGTDFICAA